MSAIDVVVVNWRRGNNILSIVDAFRQQTVACKITICDVSNGKSQIDETALSRVDEIFTWRRNHGPFNRYIPLLSLKGEYIWFHDDDMLPGSRLLEYMLECSNRPFSVMGQSGRRVDGSHYQFIEGGKKFQAVDVVCRGYWVKRRHLCHLVEFICDKERHLPDEAYRNDDMLLCQSLLQGSNMPILVTPKPPDQAKMNVLELPSPHGLCAQNNHMVTRFKTMTHLKSLNKCHQGRIFLVTAPPPQLKNIGDHAQLLGIELLLKKHAGQRPVIVLDKDQTLSSGRFKINCSDIIICQSGGNLGDRGIWSEPGRRHFIKRYGSSKIAIFPQTIYFSDTPKGVEERKITCEIYNGHPNLYVYARDYLSEEKARQLFPKAKHIGIAPDLALALDRAFTIDRKVSFDESILLCIRSDNESVFGIEEVKKELREFERFIMEISTMDDSNITEGIRAWVVAQKIEEFSRSALVITDRLHAVIFSYLARRPCIALPNVDHKVHATIETWFGYVPWIKKVDGPEQIKELVPRMLEYGKQHLEGVNFHSKLEILMRESLDTVL